ncbi:DNA-binding domain-containing protein [Antrihabitans spumae]|uniref:DNA-binding domain-containing protein n=1 Tax=Antrihabitans spumae TaxID=3373370 RepID=A0ABW7K999_9NOCA
MEAIVRFVLQTRYLTRQRPTTTSVFRDIKRQCMIRGFSAPSRGTVERRIAKLDAEKTVTARYAKDTARTR